MKTAKKVRKTISVSPEVDKALQLLSKRFKKSQSQIIEELVEEKLKELRKEERLEAFKKLVEMTENLRGIIGNKRIQNIKEEMGSEL
jgi:predicted DNA-binding protein